MSKYVITLEEYNTETDETVRSGYLGGIAPGPVPEDAPEGEFVPVSVAGVGTVGDAMLFGLSDAVNELYHMLTAGGKNSWPAGENTAMRITGINVVAFGDLGRVHPPPEGKDQAGDATQEPELH